VFRAVVIFADEAVIVLGSAVYNLPGNVGDEAL
jgi:hypothetical protein